MVQQTSREILNFWKTHSEATGQPVTPQITKDDTTVTKTKHAHTDNPVRPVEKEGDAKLEMMKNKALRDDIAEFMSVSRGEKTTKDEVLLNKEPDIKTEDVSKTKESQVSPHESKRLHTQEEKEGRFVTLKNKDVNVPKEEALNSNYGVKDDLKSLSTRQSYDITEDDILPSSGETKDQLSPLSNKSSYRIIPDDIKVLKESENHIEDSLTYSELQHIDDIDLSTQSVAETHFSNLRPEKEEVFKIDTLPVSFSKETKFNSDFSESEFEAMAQKFQQPKSVEYQQTRDTNIENQLNDIDRRYI